MNIYYTSLLCFNWADEVRMESFTVGTPGLPTTLALSGCLAGHLALCSSMDSLYPKEGRRK